MSMHVTAELRGQAQQALNEGAFEAAHRACIELLRRDPEFADAYFLLGMIASAHGNIEKALELVDRALTRQPTRTEYLAQKARCLLLLNRTSDALCTARAALQFAPESALTLDTIGVVMSKAGDHQGAVVAFEKAVALSPSDAQFYFNLGSSQQFLGRFTEAEASYERAVELKTDFFRAHWALSELGPPRATDTRVGNLQELLERHSDSAEAERYLCHALAREHERIGKFSKAFMLWQRGKQATTPFPHDLSEQNRKLFDEISTVCSADFVSAKSGYPSNEPIFVVGMPRTGTTLVEHMIGSLDSVYAAGELDDFGLALKRAAGTRSNRILDVATVKSARTLDFRSIGQAYIQRTRPRTGHTPHFVDKLPPNFLYAGFIHRALPRAKIICLMRNPLDTCLSNFRQLFSSKSPYYAYATDLLETGRYYMLFAKLAQYWKSVLPASSFLLLKYESVVANPESEARRLVDFCDLDWDDKVLDFHASGQPAATASAVQVRSPIYKNAVGRWKHYSRELEPLKALFAENDIQF